MRERKQLHRRALRAVENDLQVRLHLGTLHEATTEPGWILNPSAALKSDLVLKAIPAESLGAMVFCAQQGSTACDIDALLGTQLTQLHKNSTAKGVIEDWRKFQSAVRDSTAFELGNARNLAAAFKRYAAHIAKQPVLHVKMAKLAVQLLKEYGTLWQGSLTTCCAPYASRADYIARERKAVAAYRTIYERVSGSRPSTWAAKVLEGTGTGSYFDPAAALWQHAPETLRERLRNKPKSVAWADLPVEVRGGLLVQAASEDSSAPLLDAIVRHGADRMFDVFFRASGKYEDLLHPVVFVDSFDVEAWYGTTNVAAFWESLEDAWYNDFFPRMENNEVFQVTEA